MKPHHVPSSAPLLATVSAAVLLAACGGNSDGDAEAPLPKPTAIVNGVPEIDPAIAESAKKVMADKKLQDIVAELSTAASEKARFNQHMELVRIAWARSGDKGDDENIGVIARTPELYPVLLEQLSTERVQQYFSHLVEGDVQRYEVPGLHAINLVLHNALGGGGVCSLRSDPLGKSFAQMLLSIPVQVPRHLLLD